MTVSIVDRFSLVVFRKGDLQPFVYDDDGNFIPLTLPASPPSVLVVPAGSHTFNGDGSGGAIRLSPLTIIKSIGDGDNGGSWNFQSAGVGSGWTVFFSLETEGPSPNVDLLSDGNAIYSFPTTTQAFSQPTPFSGIYFSTGGWRVLGSKLVDTG